MDSLKLSAAAALITLFLAACGGSGGESTENAATDVTSNTTTDTVISGMASKGPITGTVNIYSLNSDGSTGSLFTSAKIDNGTYSANIGKHTGPVLIEVTGNYTDEASGTTRYITADAPLRAALSNAAGTTTAQVTPLTELAVQKAGALTASNIDSGNKLISDIFKFDIITTQPLEPSEAALSGSLVTQNQKDYTLTLAALSQLSSKTPASLFSTTLANVASGISYSGMNSQTVTDFQGAVTSFINSSNNKTGISSISATNLSRINGGTTAVFTLAIQGNIAVNAIKGIQFEVVIPAGLTVRSDASSGETFPGIVTALPAVASAQTNIYARYSTADGVLYLVIMPNKGLISVGDLATITCDILPGWTMPPSIAFRVNNVKAVDDSAAFLEGLNVVVN
jgi:hypothetical protein